MFAAFILQIVFRYLLELPDRLDQRDQRHPVDLAGAVGRGLRRHASSEEIRFDLIYAAVGRATAARHVAHQRGGR